LGYFTTDVEQLNNVLGTDLSVRSLLIRWTTPFGIFHSSLFIDTDKTRLSCLVGGVNRIGDKTRLFSVVLNILQTEKTPHFKTGQNSFDSLYLSPILFTSPTRTRQDKTKQSFLVRVSRVTRHFTFANFNY